MVRLPRSAMVALLAASTGAGHLACGQDFDVFHLDPEAGAPIEDGTSPIPQPQPDGAVTTDSGTAAPDTSVPPDTGTPIPDGAVDALVETGTDSGRDANVPCTEPGAVLTLGHCYWVTTQSQSWQQGAQTCTTAGGHLASINSDAEQTAVQALSSNIERWIGLKRPAGAAANDASYVWTTGEPRSYAHWEPGEPNGSGECVRMRVGGGWGDTSCTQTNRRSICERE